MKKSRRLLALFLCAFMLMSILPVAAFADGAEEDGFSAQAAPTIFLVGDSTVKYGSSGNIGWGERFAQYFDGVTVNNQAIAGRSSKQFWAENRYVTVTNALQPGDIVIIQWGHNDANHGNATRYTPPGDIDTAGTFQNYLKLYVEGARAKGAIPVLATVPATCNNTLNYDGEIGTFYDEINGVFLESFPKYARATRDVAAALNVPLIDVNVLTKDFFNTLPNKAEGYLQADGVHFTDAGATAIAKLIAKEMVLGQIPGYTYVKSDVVATGYKFNMGPRLVDGYINIGITDAYTKTNGFGWLQNASYSTLSRVDDGDTDVLKSQYIRGTGFKEGEDSDVTGAHATYIWPTFVVDLPAGVYNVRTVIGRQSTSYVSGAKIEEVLKAVPYYTGGLPNTTSVVPVGQYITSAAGTYKDTTFTAAVWDGQLTVELTGVNPMLCALEITPVTALEPGAKPTIHLAGDSTVAAYDANQVGWGVTLPNYFTSDVAINNAAVGGLAAKTYINDAHFNNLLQTVRPGDYLFVDWGHNDSTAVRPNRYLDPVEFKVWLKKYIDAARAFGLTPVFVTPVNMNKYDENNNFYNTFAAWTQAQREIAAAEGVTLIDLNAASLEYLQAMGPAEALKYFKTSDTTHLNQLGAERAARAVADLVSKTDLPIAPFAFADNDKDNLMIALASASVKTESKYTAASFAELTSAVAAAKALPASATQAQVDAAAAAVNAAMDGLSRLPDAAYTLPARQMEYLDRGLVAIHQPGRGVFVSWRYLGTDDPGISFNVYRNGYLVSTAGPVTDSSNFLDAGGSDSSTYSISTIVGGVETMDSAVVSCWMDNYKSVRLQKPEGGSNPSGSYEYRASDSSVGDVDGDGEYEIIVKWDPTNSKDNSSGGYTGNVYLDCYKLSGKLLWRIDLGINIRAGAHYTQFMVYDFDGDGKAEVACKTADGTVDGKGVTIGDPTKDYRNTSGYILSGPEYLTVFNGETGAAIDTVEYDPPRTVTNNWGDTYGNRMDRFLACVAYLDGVHPSLVMCRGYYTQTFLVSYTLADGKLVKGASFYSTTYPNGSQYEGQGNHSVSVADVDSDGKDEVIYGAVVFDDNLTPISGTGLGHGDAQHTGDLDPTHPGLEILSVHENTGATYGMEMRDAATGQILWGWKDGNIDVGRGITADIDPRYAGSESFSNTIVNSSEFQTLSPLYNAKGGVILPKAQAPTVPANYAIWWDGDLSRELLDADFNYAAGVGVPTVFKWDWKASKATTLLTMTGTQTNNGTKANPMLQADILGDWREEILVRTEESDAMRIYSTTAVTDTRLYTLMHNPQYRLGVAWQNVAYNQPPNVDYYLGTGMEIPQQPNIYVVGGEAQSTNLKKFNFTREGDVVQDYTAVTPVTNYTAAQGYGFEKGSAKEGVSNGPNPYQSYVRFTGKTLDSSKNFYTVNVYNYDAFLVDLPNGDYRVTAMVGANTGVIAELNRKIYPTDDAQRTISFDVAVVDGQLTLGLYNNDGALDPQLYSVVIDALPAREANKYPTVYLAGDSTVQTYNPNGTQYPMSGWGQMLPDFFKPEVRVTNFAIGGRSTKSFIADGFFDSIMRQIQPGDYLFVQFGHNDATSGNPTRFVSAADYKLYMKKYIDGARQRGAIPVIVTLVNRYDVNTGTGKFNVSFPEYVTAAQAVAAETSTLLIDLNAMSREFFEGYGPATSVRDELFMYLSAGEYPNYPTGSADATHFQVKGAIEMARLIRDGIRDNVATLAPYLMGASPNLDPPVTPENLKVLSAENGTIYLSWGKVAGAKTYEVYLRFASEPDSAYALAATVQTPNAVLNDLTDNRNYYIKVRAVNDVGASEFTDAVLAELRTVKDMIWEDFEEHTAAQLPWTLLTGNSLSGSYTGALSQAIETFGPTGKAGKYAGSGGGPRGLQLNMGRIVAYDKVDVEFDWYIGQPTSNRGQLAIQDGTKAAFGRSSFTMDNQFITFFTTNSAGSLYYMLGNKIDDANSLPATAVRLTGVTGSLNNWFKIKVSFNYTANTLSFEVKNAAGTVLDSRANLPFAEGVNYNKQIGSLRFMAGWTGSPGWTTYLDNLYIGQPRGTGGDDDIVEADKAALIAAVAVARALDPAKYIDLSPLDPILAWADDVIADITAPQADVDACLAALNEAVGKLVKVGTVITPKNSLISVKKGKTFQIVLTTDVNSAYIKYTPLNPLVATVSDTGLITGVKAGTTMILITSTDGSKITKSLTINVTN